MDYRMFASFVVLMALARQSSSRTLKHTRTYYPSIKLARDHKRATHFRDILLELDENTPSMAEVATRKAAEAAKTANTAATLAHQAAEKASLAEVAAHEAVQQASKIQERTISTANLAAEQATMTKAAAEEEVAEAVQHGEAAVDQEGLSKAATAQAKAWALLADAAAKEAEAQYNLIEGAMYRDIASKREAGGEGVFLDTGSSETLKTAMNQAVMEENLAAHAAQEAEKQEALAEESAAAAQEEAVAEQDVLAATETAATESSESAATDAAAAAAAESDATSDYEEDDYHIPMDNDNANTALEFNLESETSAELVVANVKEDPHFTGFDGSTYDFMGHKGWVYALISDKDIQVNAKFIDSKVDHNTYMGKIGIVLHNIKIVISPRQVTLNGVSFRNGDLRIKQDALDAASRKGLVEMKRRDVIINTEGFHIRVRTCHRHGIVYLNVACAVRSDHLFNPHGLLGQTAQFLVTGEDPHPVHLSPRNKDAVGLIEGLPKDYSVSSLMATDFTFNRFGMPVPKHSAQTRFASAIAFRAEITESGPMLDDL